MADVSEPDAADPRPGRRRLTPGGALAAVFGAVLFAITVQKTSPDILAGMRSVGWGFLVILLLSGVRLLLRSWA